jgi:hypothetical protein
MFLCRMKRLCTILPSLVAASPHLTNPSSPVSSSLPVLAQDIVPACAQPCLQAVLFDRFPLVCTSSADISCLCAHYSTHGESLGEVAYGCIYTSCSTVDQKAASRSYNICLGQKGAVRPTETVITITTGSSPTSTVMPSSSSTITDKARTTSPVPVQSQPTSFHTVFVDSISPVPSATAPLSQPTETPFAVQAPGPKGLSPAQIAGLAVAAAACFIFAMALIALSIYLRRRRERQDQAKVQEKNDQFRLSRASSTRLSYYNPTGSPSGGRPNQFPLLTSGTSRAKQLFPPPNSQRTASSRPPLYPSTGAHSDLSFVHPLLRPGVQQESFSSKTSLPLDQIGVAVSAEMPRDPVHFAGLQPPQKAVVRQTRRKSVRSLARDPLRPDSVMTQDTLFEEDILPARRRSSKLLPTPPVPIPPIRALQPSRPPLTSRPATDAVATQASRRQIARPPELFLNIPVQAKPFVSVNAPSQILPVASKPTPSLAPPIQLVSVHDRAESKTNSARTPDSGSAEDIPDYYFTTPRTSPQYPVTNSSPHYVVRPKQSPRLINITQPSSLSTLSRATSGASAYVRNSMASQTSFETVDSDDPTPEDEDRQLSPVVESPISKLRYPKVPRASNQLVPRSPRSQGSPRALPPSLLVKRRGQQAALNLERQLQMDSPGNEEAKQPMQSYQRHLRGNSVQAFNSSSATDQQARVQSGQWPKSPAMYDPDVVRPLNIRPRQQQPPPPPDMDALKSPMWVPRLTPTRHGDDLFISVTYSKPQK